MVKIIFPLLCLFGLMTRVLIAAPSVDASIDSTTNQAHFPVQGTITITHYKSEVIDPHSFVMEGKPLATSFVKDVTMSVSSDTLLSIYSFELPAQEKGLYVLPSISVKIGDQTYNTSPSTYQISDTTANRSAVSSTTNPSAPLIFRLEAFVEGRSNLYPGERTKLIYRIAYNRSIDLTRSELPMIHPSHFQKVGDVQIRDYQLKDVTMQDITQEVEASEMGTFSFGPSFIEGYAYNMEAGQKVYSSSLLKAEAPVVTLQVQPFPQASQPPSFTGALGQIQVESQLTSAASLSVGDTLQLQVKVQGIKNLADLSLPPLQCQPGFSGFFQFSDLPPLSEVKETAKFFYVELRPLTALIKQIPAIEMSSFNPKTNQYVVQKTSPIPLTISAHLEESSVLPSIPLLIPPPSVNQWPSPLLPPLEIQGDSIKQLPLAKSWLNSDQILWLIPIGFLLLLLQAHWKRQWDKRPKTQIPHSEILFKQAWKNENVQLLEQAFWSRLWEKGQIPQGITQLERVPLEGQLAPIHAFLFQLQAWQYSAEKNVDFKQIKKQADQLFHHINNT